MKSSFFLGCRLLVHGLGLVIAASTKQAEHGRRGALTQGHARLVLLAVAVVDLIEELDGDREANRRVQVTLGNVETEALGHQAQTNHQQEAQTQHHHCRMLVDELGQRLGGQQHQAHGNDDGCHHDVDVVHHAHGGDDGVQGEHGIEHHDLRHHQPETRVHAVLDMHAHGAFEALMQLGRGLEQQKQAARQQDQVATGKGFAQNREQWRCEGDQPGHHTEQAEAHDDRKTQADDAGLVTLMRGKFVCQNGNENQIVDAEDHLENDQGDQRDPYRWVQQEFHKPSVG